MDSDTNADDGSKPLIARVAIALSEDGRWSACGGYRMSDELASEFALDTLGRSDVEHNVIFVTVEIPVRKEVRDGQ